MPTSANVSQIGYFNIQNAQIPKEGPKAMGAVLNFFGGNFSALVDLTQNQMAGQISFIQGLYVDASQSAVGIIIQVQGSTNQRIVIPAGTEVYTPILAQNPPVFTFAGVGNASPNCLVPVYFCNVPLPALELGASAAVGFSFSGANLLVQDTAAETSLASLAANLGVFPSNALAGAANTNGAAATTIIAAQGAGVQIFVTSLQLWNSSATGVTATLNDSASTEFYVPATGGSNVVFNSPLSVAANTPLQFTPGAAVTTLGANAQGFKAA